MVGISDQVKAGIVTRAEDGWSIRMITQRYSGTRNIVIL
jgi:hypothetical protein